MGTLFSRNWRLVDERNFNVRLSQLENSEKMLKRRPSKRFVLAESGEETAWNTTTDNDPTPAPMPPPPQIEVGLITVASSSQIEDIAESPPIAPSPTVSQLLTVPQPIKSGMK